VKVPIDSIAAHPKNYRGHPDAQVDAIRHSLDQFGQYRPVVVSSDGVILAGHGVWLAQKATGATDIDTVRMDFPHTDPRAEKLMVADNELSRMAQDDDRALATLLADIQRTDGLDGTGWDDGALDALIGELAAEEAAQEAAGAGDRQTLAERFGAPPFSVLDARQGYWQDRKRQWLALGIQSELGRGAPIGGAPMPLDRGVQYD